MFTVVAGGGKVGYHLAKALLNMGHEIVLMEKNLRKADTLSADLGSIVHARDACEGRWLLHAGVTRADLVVAVTGDDEDNLIICQLAGTLSGDKART
ncbi:MAG: NAD-binding protein, partial [Gammaproteobacteria bacterium]|nr:NAD-binding protein [Gammaproteobacteria bacterium]